MNRINMIDMHCDTLTKFAPDHPDAARSINHPANEIALSKMEAGARWAQFFAIFIPDELRGEAAVNYFDFYRDSFYRQMEANADRMLPCRSYADLENAFAANKSAGILTVEGGCVLAGRMERVQAIADAGVKALTLVWNGANEIGSGHNNIDQGLTAFGKEVIPALEAANILVDVSHLNDKGFEDLLKVAKKPFIATHSNARVICSHKRNLPDEYIQEMVRRGTLIGLNYHRAFLSNEEGVDSFDDLYRHVCHFLELGAGHCLALGSDYDGAMIAPCLDSVEKSLLIADELVKRGIAQSVADDIMFNNAYRFFAENLK